MRTQRLIRAIATLVVLAGATQAHADAVKCSRTIAKEYGKYIATASKIIDKCKNGVIAKATPASLAGCPDAAGQAKIASAASGMKAKIAGACGGADKTCDGNGDDSLASIHWNTGQCMGFEGQCGAIALGDCGDIGDCLLCIGDAAVEQGVDGLLYDRLNPASFAPNNASEPNKTINKCQVAVTKNAVKFLQAKTKILNKCWDAKLNNKAGFADAQPCPDTNPSVPNKSVDAINKAEQKKIAAICKACGAGGDADKNGVCDIPPGLALNAIVQTPFTCPNVSVPPNAVHPIGEACGAIAVADLQSYADCIDCVLEFKADCVTHAGVGDNSPAAGIDYPAQCNPGPTPTPTPTTGGTQTPQPTCTPKPNCGNGIVEAGLGEECDPAVVNSCPGNAACAPANVCDACTCPDGTFTLSATAGADLDTGWTGIAHDQAALTGHLFDADAYGCSSSGADKQCTFVSRYTLPFFGSPLPLSSGGVPVCVVNIIVGAPNGTLDLVTGELHYNYDLTSQVHNGLSVDHPCPTCDGDPGFDDGVFGGTCNGGPSNGSPCDADGASPLFGKTSFNCLPDSGANIGNLPISFKDANTGAKTVSTSASSPNCTAFGFTALKCYCDTCDTAAAEPCSSDADCPVGRTCGGLRCLVDAPTPGAQCSSEGTGSDPACCSEPTCTTGTIGTCGHPGEATKPNACSNGNCVVSGLEGPDDARCQIAPNDNLCSVDTFRACIATADCRPPAEGGTCGNCTPGGQNCITKRRECFRSTVTKHGTAGIPNGAYVGNFCIAPTGSSAVNGVAGLPGLGALRLPYALSNISIP